MYARGDGRLRADVHDSVEMIGLLDSREFVKKEYLNLFSSDNHEQAYRLEFQLPARALSVALALTRRADTVIR